MKALELFDKTRERMIGICQAAHKESAEEAEQRYEVEAFHFKSKINSNKYLQDCTAISTIGAFIEVITNGLSFESSANHVYLMPRNVKVESGWEKRMSYSYAVDGVIRLCTDAGSIKNCSAPVIVYEGDDIVIKTVGQSRTVDHTQKIPRQSNKILGGYCFIETDSGVNTFWMDINEIDRLKKYSAKQNKNKANELYSAGTDGQIDEGFFKTKIVKAALKYYPKKSTNEENYYDEDEFQEGVTIISDPSDLPENTSPQSVDEAVPAF